MSRHSEFNPDLIARIRDPQDASAWNHFVHGYEPIVLAFCRKQGLQQADSVDVVQDVFAAVAKAMPAFHYDATRGSFRAWLMKVTRSKLADYFNKRGRCKESIEATLLAQVGHRDELSSFERDESLNLEWSLFDRIRGEIKPEFRPATWTAFWLTAMQGFTAEEVAAYLEVSVQAVYIAKSRVLKRFRARVRELAAEA